MRVIIHSSSIQDRDGPVGCSPRSAGACCLTGSPPHFPPTSDCLNPTFRHHCIGRLSHGVGDCCCRAGPQWATHAEVCEPANYKLSLCQGEPSSSTAEKPSFGTLAPALPQSMLGIANGPMREYTSFGTP
jgi:hypothetical protein